MDEDLGVEITFADGPFVVDTPFVSLIREATDGEPERFTRKEAMALIGPLEGARLFRTNINQIKSQHLRNFGG